MATMPTVIIEPLQAEVVTLRLRPGDVLLLRFARSLPAEVREAVRQGVEAVIAPNKAMLLCGDVEVSVIERVEPDAVAGR